LIGSANEVKRKGYDHVNTRASQFDSRESRLAKLVAMDPPRILMSRSTLDGCTSPEFVPVAFSRNQPYCATAVLAFCLVISSRSAAPTWMSISLLRTLSVTFSQHKMACDPQRYSLLSSAN
jgi:hypothetical protein